MTDNEIQEFFRRVWAACEKAVANGRRIETLDQKKPPKGCMCPVGALIGASSGNYHRHDSHPWPDAAVVALRLRMLRVNERHLRSFSWGFDLRPEPDDVDPRLYRLGQQFREHYANA